MSRAPVTAYSTFVVAESEVRSRVAEAIRRARKRYGTMRSFAGAVRDALGWPSLSPAAVYAWESGETRVPAVALVVAAELTGMSLDGLLDRESPIDSGDGELHAMVRRLEERVHALEHRQSQLR